MLPSVALLTHRFGSCPASRGFYETEAARYETSATSTELRKNYKANIALFAIGEKTESQENMPEAVVAILETEKKVMVLKFSRAIKTNFSLQRKQSRIRRKSSHSRAYKK